MASQLQEAINETRNGNEVEAQKILADILKADTNNVQAWYLLALLIDSPEKKHAYLNRVLTLDPNHEKAKEALSELNESDTMPSIISTFDDAIDDEIGVPVVEEDTIISSTASFEEPTDFIEETALPSWLEEDKEHVPEEMLIEEEPSEIFNAELPDWLAEEGTPIKIQDEPPTLISESQPKELEAMLAEHSDDVKDASEAISLEPTSNLIETTESTALDQSTTSASVRPWNIALLFLILFTLLTLIAIFFQLSNLL